MPEKPPYMPTGIGMGMLTDDETKVGVLIFETAQGNFDFAVNLQAVDVLTKAISKIEMHLRSGRAH
jgi:DNA-binding LytR/AlgR family response regulator